jgi:hypothetical protein
MKYFFEIGETGDFSKATVLYSISANGCNPVLIRARVNRISEQF